MPAPQLALLSSNNGQHITAHSVALTAEDGAAASISNQIFQNPLATGTPASPNQTLVVSGGGISIRSSGGAPVSGPGASSAQITNFSFGDQAATGDQLITVSGGGNINVLSTGGFAGISNSAFNSAGVAKPGGSQTVTVSGGGNLDVQSAATSGGAFISQSALGAAQSVSVTDGQRLKVNGSIGNASIGANGGTQTVSITGGGANAIELGSAGALGFSTISGGSSQEVTAGSGTQLGSIRIVGPSTNATSANLGTRATSAGSQKVSTTGLLSITGGSAPNQTFVSGLLHAGGGQQTIEAGAIELRGGQTAGTSGNTASILLSSNTPAGISGKQLIDVQGDLTIAGGAGGTAGINGSLTGQQTIYADNINVTNSAGGGFNSLGFILGGHQDIHATGDVTLAARASGGDLPGVRIGGLAGAAPTATDLVLSVGGDLVLSGGSAPNNGVGIGSTAAPGVPALRNDIAIDVQGNVILNSGVASSGVRIGSPQTVTGPGDISISAGGEIRLNGVEEFASIRTLGTVNLDAASITEAAKGRVIAGTLNIHTIGDALLTGPNEVAFFTAATDMGNVSFTNIAPVLTLGSMDLPGALTIDQAGELRVGSAAATAPTMVYAAGDISIVAGGNVIVRGSDTTAGAASALLADGDLTVSADRFSLVGGAALATPVAARGQMVTMTLGHNLAVTGGSGTFSPAVLSSGSSMDLTVGGQVRVDAGSGYLSLARIQTEIRDGVIHMTFPNLTSGGYFVNGLEGDNHHGQTGFFTLNKPAKLGSTLLVDYGT